MILSRLLLVAATATLLATCAHAESPAEAATHLPPPTDTGMGIGGHGDGWHHLLTDDERMMLRLDSHRAVAGMTTDQKKAYRQQQRARFMAMSEAGRAAFKADLAARWAALPADRKARIEARMQARMAEHHGTAAE